MFVKSFSLQYYAYGSLGPGPGFFPLWLNGGLVVLSLIFIGGAFKHPEISKNILPHGQGLKNVLATLAAVLLFIFIARTTGFAIASTLMLMAVLGRVYNWRKALTIALCITLVLLVLFQHLLDVPLPVNIWGW
jgi:putative tricarboxylic transport membrane protein